MQRRRLTAVYDVKKLSGPSAFLYSLCFKVAVGTFRFISGLRVLQRVFGGQLTMALRVIRLVIPSGTAACKAAHVSQKVRSENDTEDEFVLSDTHKDKLTVLAELAS